MRGRYPSGPECVEDFEGSEQAKQRLRVILETMTGKYRVPEACRILNICEQRFYQLRAAFVRASLKEFEPKTVGRPRHQAESEEVTALRAQLAEMQQELQAAHVREEIALVLPNRVQAEDEPEKKDRCRRRGERDRGSGRSNAATRCYRTSERPGGRGARRGATTCR